MNSGWLGQGLGDLAVIPVPATSRARRRGPMLGGHDGRCPTAPSRARPHRGGGPTGAGAELDGLCDLPSGAGRAGRPAAVDGDPAVDVRPVGVRACRLRLRRGLGPRARAAGAAGSLAGRGHAGVGRGLRFAAGAGTRGLAGAVHRRHAAVDGDLVGAARTTDESDRPPCPASGTTGHGGAGDAGAGPGSRTGTLAGARAQGPGRAAAFRRGQPGRVRCGAGHGGGRAAGAPPTAAGSGPAVAAVGRRGGLALAAAADTIHDW